jgi:LAO/AO transport system kinase
MAKKEYETALHFLTPITPTWYPPVLTCSALTMDGVDNVWETVLDHRKKMSATGELEEKRKKQALEWLYFLVKEGLEHWFYKNEKIQRMLPELRKNVEAGKMAPTVAARDLLFLLDNKLTV